jgi:flagellin
MKTGKEIQEEINQLATELTRIANTTEFNTKTLLDGTFVGTFHIGANENQNISLDIGAMDAATLLGGVNGGGGTGPASASTTLHGVTFTAVDSGAAGNGIVIEFVDPGEGDKPLEITVDTDNRKITVSLATNSSSDITSDVDSIVSAINGHSEASTLVTASGSGTDTVQAGTATLSGGSDGGGSATNLIDVTTQTAANDAIATIQTALDSVSTERSKLGAVQNRLEHTINNLSVAAENLTAAESRIRDVDMAQEMMEFTKNQILIQAGTAMLANANVRPQSVLQLLG